MAHLLTDIRGLQSEELSIWGERVTEAVERARVVYMSMAKL
jgi:hypothetical protein